MEEAMSAGFRKCAGYIFGKNAPRPDASRKQTIAMTAPVMAEVPAQKRTIAMTAPVMAEAPSGGAADAALAGTYTVSFTMPGKWTLDTLPVPLDPDVRLTAVAPETVAALTWHGGSPREAETRRREATLRAALEAAGVRVARDAKTKIYQYNPPWDPPYMRTNEVLLAVD